MKKILLILLLMFSLLLGCNNPNIFKLEFETYSISNVNNLNCDFAYDFEFINSYDKLLSLQNKLKEYNQNYILNFTKEDLIESKILLIQTQKRSTSDIFTLSKAVFQDKKIIIESIYEKVYWHIHMSGIVYSFIKIPNNKKISILELNVTYLIQQKDLENYTKDKLTIEMYMDGNNQNI